MTGLATAPAVWLTVLALPALVALALFVPGLRRPATRLGPWTPLAFAALLFAAPLGARVSAPWVLLGLELELGELARPFGWFSALVWLLAGLSIGASEATPRGRRRLLAASLLTMAGNLALIVAGDLASVYLSFAVLSFAGYGLVIHDRSARAQRAARVYIVFVVLGELALFAGLMLAASGSTSLALASAREAIAGSDRAPLIAALLLLGFGIKAGLPIAHVWIPLAHSAAPTPASAVLSGVLVEAGVLGWLRLIPLGRVALPSLGLAVLVAGLFAAFYAVLVGLPQRESKLILAYSTVSQMGLVAVAIGVALIEPEAAPAASLAATVFVIHHGLSKAALFLAVGVVHRRLGRAARIAVGLAVIALGFSLAGAPASAGAVAKHALARAVEEAPAGYAEPLAMLLSLSSAATTLLVLRLLARLHREAGCEREPASLALALPWALAAAAGLVGAWLLAWLRDPALARETLAHPWSSTWPVLLGLGGYLAAILAARRRSWRLPGVPPGDVLVLFERALTALGTGARRLAARVDERLPRARVDELRARASALLRRLLALEDRLGWTLAALLLLGLATVLALLSAVSQ